MCSISRGEAAHWIMTILMLFHLSIFSCITTFVVKINEKLYSQSVKQSTPARRWILVGFTRFMLIISLKGLELCFDKFKSKILQGGDLSHFYPVFSSSLLPFLPLHFGTWFPSENAKDREKKEGMTVLILFSLLTLICDKAAFFLNV